MYTATLKDKGTLRDKITLQVEFDNKVAEPLQKTLLGGQATKSTAALQST